jgi:16S rRNA (adenine1518-N6/adenine1519-N6)-dimethyltransferase
LAVLSQWRTVPRMLFGITAEAFTPRPKVDSALVELVPRAAPTPPCDVSRLEKVTAAAFGQRRKMLRSALRQIAPNSEALLAELGIDPKARAEDLAVGEFCRIANALSREGRDAR